MRFFGNINIDPSDHQTGPLCLIHQAARTGHTTNEMEENPNETATEDFAPAVQMIKAFSVIGRTIALWWREFILLTFFNLAWLALQVPIVTGPPATAAMYALARRVVDAEWISPLDGWSALRQMFLPA